MPSIFITTNIPDVGIQPLRDKGYRVDIYPNDTIPTQKELIKYLKKYPYDAVLCMLNDKIDSAVFEAVPSISMIASYTVGYDNIDILEAKKRGIVITNTAGVSQIPVAEHAVALMLGVTTRMIEADNFVRKGKYKGWTPMAFMAMGLSGVTVGLIGTGAIGDEVARIVYQGFGAQVLYYDPVHNEHIEKEYNACRCVDAEEVLRRADIVSLHVPLIAATHHLINAQRLALMKPTSFLINTSRGPVIDEQALVTALQNGTIAGAGLDVFEFEPKLSRGLVRLPNVILTPHIASARQKVREAMGECAAENIIDFFEGRTPRNSIEK